MNIEQGMKKLLLSPKPANKISWLLISWAIRAAKPQAVNYS